MISMGFDRSISMGTGLNVGGIETAKVNFTLWIYANAWQDSPF